MDDGSTQLAGLQVSVPAAAKTLAQELVAGTTFAGLPAGGPGSTGALFPQAIGLSGTDSLAVGPASLTLGASSSYQVFALTGSFTDPDGVVAPAAGAAWLKHELDAQVSGSASGTAAGAQFGLDAGVTARLLDYRRHAATDPVAPAVLAEIAHPRLPTRIADLQAMAPGDAVAFVVSGQLAFHAVFTYTDFLQATIAVLDAALGVAGASSFEVSTSASVEVDFGASDAFRLVFTRGTSLDLAVDLEKTKSTNLAVGATLGIRAALTNPTQLAGLIESYVAGRLGAPLQDFQSLLGKLATATDTSQLSSLEQKLLQAIVEKLGWGDAVASFEAVKAKLLELPADLQAALQAKLSQQLSLAFTVSYSRVEVGQTLISFEANASALEPFLSALLAGNTSQLAVRLAAGDPGLALHNYLSTRTITRQLSFGVSLSIGSWAAVGKTTTTTVRSVQTNAAQQVRQSFDGRTAYQSQWGKSGENYGFELAASMGRFAAAPTAAELTFAMSLSWEWDQVLTPALAARILDLAQVWRIVDPTSAASADTLFPALLKQQVHAELSLTIGDPGVRRLAGIPEPQYQKAWIQAMAESLPRVDLPGSVLAVSLLQRRAVYQGAAGWVFAQQSPAQLSAAPDYGKAQPPIAAIDALKLRQIDLPSGSSTDANSTVYSLDALWQPTSKTESMRRLYDRVTGSFNQLESFLDGTASYPTVEGVFSQLSAVAGRDYPARLLGSVFAQVLGGAVALVSGTLTVTPTAGGTSVVMVGATGP